MANKKISQLDAAAALTGGELVPVVQSSTTVKTTVQDVADLAVPYSVYTALLTQTGTNAPVATVLQNTIGNIVWTYASVGSYNATLTNAFPSGKLYLYVSSDASYNIGPQLYQSLTRDLIRVTDSIINLSQTELVFTSGVFTSAGSVNGFTNISIEIRVYP